MNLSMRIGEVARLTGLDVRLIRHYEKIGLIPPPRRREAGYAQAGYRLFTEEHVQRLQFIRLCRLLDLPLREIGELLSCVDEGCCASARPGLHHALAAKLEEVDRRIALLQDLRRRLHSAHEGLAALTEQRESATCKAGASPVACAVGDANRHTAPGNLTLVATAPLEPPTVGKVKSKGSFDHPKGLRRCADRARKRAKSSQC